MVGSRWEGEHSEGPTVPRTWMYSPVEEVLAGKR